VWTALTGCSIATVIWIAMPFLGIAAIVLWGRHSTQSRQRVVEARLVTCEQREAGTPGQGWTLLLRRCQPLAGANCTGTGRAPPVDAPRAVRDRCVASVAAVLTATSRLMRNSRHIPTVRSTGPSRSRGFVLLRRLTRWRAPAFGNVRPSGLTLTHRGEGPNGSRRRSLCSPSASPALARYRSDY
jgi:hypothetical protein